MLFIMGFISIGIAIYLYYKKSHTYKSTDKDIETYNYYAEKERLVMHPISSKSYNDNINDGINQMKKDNFNFSKVDVSNI